MGTSTDELHFAWLSSNGINSVIQYEKLSSSSSSLASNSIQAIAGQRDNNNPNNNRNNNDDIQIETTLVQAGLEEYNLRNFTAAIDKYDKALQINANDASIWYDKGRAFAALGRYGEAIDAYDNALRIENNYADVWNNRGVAL